MTEITPEKIIAKALSNVSIRLGINANDLTEIVGDFEPFSDMSEDSETSKRALLVLRIYKSLQSEFRCDFEQMQRWLTTDNDAAGGVPIAQMKTPEGLREVVQYLEAIHH